MDGDPLRATPFPDLPAPWGCFPLGGRTSLAASTASEKLGNNLKNMIKLGGGGGKGTFFGGGVA